MIPSFYLDLALVLTLIALAGSVLRAIIGPTLTDRMIALDMGTGLGIILISVLAMRAAMTSYLDIALALALTGLLGTLALARYLFRRHETPRHYGDPVKSPILKPESKP